MPDNGEFRLLSECCKDLKLSTLMEVLAHIDGVFRDDNNVHALKRKCGWSSGSRSRAEYIQLFDLVCEKDGYCRRLEIRLHGYWERPGISFQLAPKISRASPPKPTLSSGSKRRSAESARDMSTKKPRVEGPFVGTAEGAIESSSSAQLSLRQARQSEPKRRCDSCLSAFGGHCLVCRNVPSK